MVSGLIKFAKSQIKYILHVEIVLRFQANNRIKVKHNGQMSAPIVIAQAIKQDDLLVPLLFNF